MIALPNLNNDLEVRYRIGRAGRHSVDWEPWTTGKLYVRRREKDLPKRMRWGCANWKAGKILTITVRDPSKCWCEYSEADYVGDGVFLNEDYYLEVEGLR
jgi:hypothetical protein